MQWKGKEDSVSGVQGADYITGITVPPRKFLILLIIQEDLASSQKWAATLKRKDRLSCPQDPVLFTHTQSPPSGTDEQTSSLLSRKPVCSEL